MNEAVGDGCRSGGSNLRPCGASPVHPARPTAGLEWSEDHLDVELSDGYYSIEVGSTATLGSSVFDGSVRYLSVAEKDSDVLTGRMSLLTVPYAVRSDTATKVDGGDVVADSLTMPTRPSFSATGVDVTHTSDGAKLVTWNDTVGRSFDIGDVYNQTSDRFTALVDGIY